MKKIQTLLLFLTLLLTTQCTNDNDFSDNSITFITSNEIPLVEGTLNGKKAYWIIDSGASYCVVDVNQSKKYEFTVIDDPQQVSIAGIGGVVSRKLAINIDAFIGGMEVDVDFKSQDLSSVQKAIMHNNGINVVGILGSDWFNKNKLIIDYSTNQLRK